MDVALLPAVVAPGSVLGRISRDIAAAFGLPEDVLVVAGTTDGCASFLATGAAAPGDGVTVLGTTLTIKVLADAPIFAPEYGIYSHRIGGLWLAGGASNTGGGVLAQFFDGAAIADLSRRIDPSTESGLDYYPLPRAGERFPVSDPALAPRMTPRPADDAEFLKGLLEGIASVESLGYRRLSELGAPPLRAIRTVGGGAGNPAWTAIRQRTMPVPFLPALSEEAAMGAALLALRRRGAGRGHRMKAPLRTRLADLIGTFDTFFVDQFGVLHDGQQLYDGAAEALCSIRARNRRVVLLSNSGKRSQPNSERLRDLGISPDCYDLLVTSGEVAWHMLSEEKLQVPRRPDGRLRCLLLERAADGSAIAGLGYEQVDNGADADLVMIAGSEGDRLTLADYRQCLAPAAERKVPALCTNPDKIMLTASGPCFGPGRIGELYEQLGGTVTWIGKPFPDIYRAAIDAIGAASTDDILCVGDSVEHDIAGAHGAGLTSALVRSGILAELSEAELADVYALQRRNARLRIAGFLPCLNRERFAEAIERQLVVSGGPGFQTDGAAIAHLLQGPRDGRIVDLAGSRFLAARHIGHLDLADMRQRLPAQRDQVPFADLPMMEVEIELQRRPVPARVP